MIQVRIYSINRNDSNKTEQDLSYNVHKEILQLKLNKI